MSDYIEEILGSTGILSKLLPGYEVREGQIEMAKTIDSAMNVNNHSLAEGPTGVGKSFGYLIPAIHHATRRHKRVMIATANIVLQDQLVDKDLPFLQDALAEDYKFTFSVLKGKSNYLCSSKLTEIVSDAEENDGSIFRNGLNPEELDELVELAEWALDTHTGDKSELESTPSYKAWNEISCSPDDCERNCDEYKEMVRPCVYNATYRQAEMSNIVVVNYHLLFADLNVRMQTQGRASVLPHYDILIGDEAHDLPDIARDFFGFRVSYGTVNRFIKVLNRLSETKVSEALKKELQDFMKTLKQVKERLFPKTRIEGPGLFSGTDQLNLTLSEASSIFSREARKHKELEDQPYHAAQRTFYEGLMADVARTISALHSSNAVDDPNAVIWVEDEGRGFLSLRSKAKYAGPILAAHLFEHTPSVNLTSATLSTDRSFKFIIKELGLGLTKRQYVTAIAQSPFDYQNQAALVIPNGPEPKYTEDFIDFVTRGVTTIIEKLQGKTLVLFTAKKTLNIVCDAVRERTSLKILKQYEASSAVLLDEFRKDKNSVLMGTSSFWQGIDIPGESLSCVVIDKLPFPSPADPLMDSLQDELGFKAFTDHSVPRGIIAFKQGFGRLIRTKTDRGLVICFDPRLLTKKTYGKSFIRSLPDPDIAITDDLEESLEILLDEET